jgi:hypothetical protein
MIETTQNPTSETAAAASSPYVTSIRELASRLNAMECGLAAFDAEGTLLFSAPGPTTDAAGSLYAAQAMAQFRDSGRPVCFCGPNQTTAACILADGSRIAAIVLVQPPADVLSGPRERQWLTWILEEFARTSVQRHQVLGQIDKIGGELSQAYEEIILLYNLSTHMKVTKSTPAYLQMACDELTQLVQVEGIAIFLDKKHDGRKQLTLTAGAGVMRLDPTMADVLQMQLAAELTDGKEALLDSCVAGPFK